MSQFEAQKRVWRALQIQGILGKNEGMPFTEKMASSVNIQEYQAAALEAYYKPNRIERKKQKLESMLEAFSMVPKSDLLQLSEIFRPDCELFGYDNRPNNLFNISSNTSQTTFRYFLI